MQHVLVVGGAGFIGSNLCQSLLKENYRVTCIDNFITGNKKNVENLLSNPSFSLIEYDVSQVSPDSKPHIERVDYIFHLASPASPNKKSSRSYIAFPIETLLVNALGTYNLLQLAKEDSAKFLYASTSEVYGDPAVSPQPETYFGNVNPNGVRSVYDEAKRYGEAMTMAFVRKHGVDARIIRIFNTFGPNMQKDDGRVVSNFITQALANEPLTIYGSGDQTRSFCYVDDMVEGIKKALFTDDTKGEVINLGNPDERTIKDLGEMIQRILKSESKFVFEEAVEDDPKKRCPDITKAKNLLGWQPVVPLEEGLRKTAEYFRSA